MVWYNKYIKNTKEGVVKIMRKTNVKKISKVKQKMQSNSGITLVALIVTIIVLLILAFISIATLTGENGILGMAKKAKDENENATNDELAKLKQMELMTKEVGEIPDINAEIDGLPAKKTLEELPGYIPIYTPEQFEKIASGETNYVISDLSGKQIGTYNMEPGAKYALMEDLDFSSMSGVKPVKGFTGELEGNGCYIRNVTISTVGDAEDYVDIMGNGERVAPVAGLFQTIVNGTVKNLAITNSNFDSSRTTGAIAGHIDNSTIDNCYVKDTVISGNVNAGGFVGGIAQNGSSISNCKAISISTNKSSLAGIAYVSIGETNIKNCQVISTNSQAQYSTGILYCAKKVINIEGCKVQDLNISGNAGIVNVCLETEKIEIKDCTVKGANIKYIGAGIVKDINSGDTEIIDCKVEKIGFPKSNSSEASAGIIETYSGTGNLKIENCTAKELTGGVGAGIIDHTRAPNTNIYDCYAEDVKTSSKNFGGIARTIAKNYYLSGEKLINIENCVAKKLKITADCGGIIYSSGVDKTNIKNCITENIEKTESYNSTNGTSDNFGGIVGVVTDLTNVESCNVSNINFSEQGCNSNIGGIIGYGRNVSMKNCELKEISFRNVASQNVGGAAGCIQSNKGIENININGVNIETTYKNLRVLGGIAGFVDGGTLKNCNINNINIEYKDITDQNDISASVGGIIGLTMDTEISKCNVKNGKVKIGKNSGAQKTLFHLGGIAGLATNVQDCTVENIIVDSQEGNIRGTGGIIGHSDNFSDSIIKNCKVTNTEISGKESTGGICGAAATIINGCTVENSKITSDGKYVGGIQGHGGYRERDSQKSITIENCNVNNTAIKGTQWVDYIQGRNSHKTDSDTDTTTEDKITNCNYDSKTTKN